MACRGRKGYGEGRLKAGFQAILESLTRRGLGFWLSVEENIGKLESGVEGGQHSQSACELDLVC